jgi:hypothetical protein
MTLARLKLALWLAAFAAVAAFLHYSLPQRDIVRIVGTDVVRQDVEATDANGNPVTLTRDVRYIYTKTPGGGDRVYRNEDTGWGWPPYFKFDSADLAAQASDQVSTADNPKWVVVRHYGWRIPLLSMFPNATSIRPAAGPDEALFPWFNVTLVGLLLLVVLVVRRLVILLFRAHVDPVVDEIEREIDEQSGRIRRGARRTRRWLRHHFGV